MVDKKGEKMGKIIWKDEYDNVETYESIPEFLSDWRR